MSDAPWMVLVGPPGTGKTTLGREVAAMAGRPFIDLDAVGDLYYAEVGWSIARLRERFAVVGRVAAEAEWEPARAHAVSRVVADYPGAVIALGAGHTSYVDGGCLASVQRALRNCRQVVQVLPSPDKDFALAALRQRCTATKGQSWIVDGYDFLTRWLDEPGTRLVATRSVYTQNETPTQTATRLLHDNPCPAKIPRPRETDSDSIHRI